MEKRTQDGLTRRQVLAGGAAAGAALALAGKAPAFAQQKLEKVRMSCWSNRIAEQANIYAAEENGSFKEQGIDFEFAPGQGGGDALKHVLAGNAHVAMANWEALLFAVDQGAKLVSIYNVYPQNVFNVVSLKKSNIKKPADLKGHKVGAYSMASGTRYNLMYILAQSGMSEKDVETVAVGIFNFAPLMEGKVIATAATDTGLWDAQQKGLGEVDIIWARDYLNVPTDIFVTTEELFKTKPEVLRRFLKAYKMGTEFALKDPEKAAGLAPKYAVDGKDPKRNLTHLQYRLAASVSEGTKKNGLGWHDMDILEQAARRFHELGLVKNKPDVAAAVTNRFIKEL
jgi:NitT/TauT family transport system substrate-binding protein